MGAMILSAIFIFNKIKQNANKRPNLKSYNSIVRTRKRKNIEYLNILISAILTYILTFIPIMIMNYVSLDHSFCCNSSLMTLADFILYIKYWFVKFKFFGTWIRACINDQQYFFIGSIKITVSVFQRQSNILCEV